MVRIQYSTLGLRVGSGSGRRAAERRSKSFRAKISSAVSPDSGPNFVRHTAACWNTGILLIIALNCPLIVDFAQFRPTLQHFSSWRQTLHNIAPSSQYSEDPLIVE